MRWFKAITNNIAKSRGYKEILLKVVSQKKFWHYDRVTEEHFLEHADTGDLILFRAKSFMANV